MLDIGRFSFDSRDKGITSNDTLLETQSTNELIEELSSENYRIINPIKVVRGKGKAQGISTDEKKSIGWMDSLINTVQYIFLS